MFLFVTFLWNLYHRKHFNTAQTNLQLLPTIVSAPQNTLLSLVFDHLPHPLCYPKLTLRFLLHWPTFLQLGTFKTSFEQPWLLGSFQLVLAPVGVKIFLASSFWEEQQMPVQLNFNHSLRHPSLEKKEDEGQNDLETTTLERAME